MGRQVDRDRLADAAGCRAEAACGGGPDGKPGSPLKAEARLMAAAVEPHITASFAAAV